MERGYPLPADENRDHLAYRHVVAFSFLDRPVTVVGILNVTPDSFSDGGRFTDVHRAVEHGVSLQADGAHLVDVGGESTRPGAAPITLGEELDRVIPVVAALAVRNIPVSVDTRRAAVAATAIEAGAVVVNDVTGLRDDAMIEVVRDAAVPAIVMHAPYADMTATHAHTGYDDVVTTVVDFLRAQIERALDAGVTELVADPGIGFGKLLDDNVAILRHLDQIVALGFPVLVGASRKRFLGTLTGVDDPAGRDAASIAAHLLAVERGATAIRVHDVAGHVHALRVWTAVNDQIAGGTVER